MVCTSAFVGVFLLLAFLALIMKAIMAIFPSKMGGTDSAVLAAVASAVSSAYPGTKITKIEEIK
jgi:hypothetical protein